jgi:putative permease
MTPAEDRSPGPGESVASRGFSGNGAGSGPTIRELSRVVTRFLLTAAALVALLWFLHEVRWGVLVLLVAAILAIFLNAPVTVLERRGLSRRLAVAVVILALLVGATLLGWLILPRLAREVPRFLDLLPQLVQELAERATQAAGESPELEHQISMVITWMLETIRGMWQYANTALQALVASIVIFALVLFMLLDPRPMLATYLQLLPEDRRVEAARAFARSAKMIVGWVAANVIVGGIRGVAAYLFLQFMGVPGALLWGVLSFVTALIPRVGFYIMTIPPVLVAAADSFQTALWTAIFFIVVDEILGNFVVPRIQAETMELHPAFILGMTVLMALAFGMVGVLIAAPVAGIIKAHVEEFHLARKPPDPRVEEQVDAMLSGRPREAGGGAAE